MWNGGETRVKVSACLASANRFLPHISTLAKDGSTLQSSHSHSAGRECRNQIREDAYYITNAAYTVLRGGYVTPRVAETGNATFTQRVVKQNPVSPSCKLYGLSR